ncbi:MAG: hypothetical protein KGZ46_06205 [Hydrogenophaga sp.]|nr:hypothetical protein [Hydrogenophaga sp.]
MLKVFLHNGAPAAVSQFNQLGRLDIGYEKLDIHADYKAVLRATGLGEFPPAVLQAYPRWTASVWDLVMRMIALCIHREEAFPALDVTRRGAFAQNLTAIVEHWPDGLEFGRATVGTAHIRMTRRRGRYVATFEDDILGAQTSIEFAHTPDALMPWDLLARAYAWASHGRATMPARPALYMPIPFEEDGEVYVSVDTVREPARTGLFRWMVAKGIRAFQGDQLTGTHISESNYVSFLRSAV